MVIVRARIWSWQSWRCRTSTVTLEFPIVQPLRCTRLSRTLAVNEPSSTLWFRPLMEDMDIVMIGYEEDLVVHVPTFSFNTWWQVVLFQIEFQAWLCKFAECPLFALNLKMFDARLHIIKDHRLWLYFTAFCRVRFFMSFLYHGKTSSEDQYVCNVCHR